MQGFGIGGVTLALALTLLACSSGESPPAGGGGGGDGATGPGGAPATSGGGGGAAPAPLRVLFVGNSYTYVNDLPGVVDALDEATPAVALEVSSVVVGGATLQDHWVSTGARDSIETGQFDVVVLQGQSVEPITQPDVFQTYAGLLGQAARDAGGHAVWYATWARREGDAFYTFGDPATPAEMTAALDAGYVTASGGVEPVAHVGQAWELALTDDPSLVLYADDGSHPSPAGTLLAAFVMFRAVSGVEAVVPDPPPLGIDAAVAAELHSVAAGVSP